MIFTPIAKKQLEAAYQILSRQLKNGQQFTKTITWRPNKTVRRVYWHQKQNFWGSPNASDYWCPFGVTNPSSVSTLRMTCQINPAQNQDDRSRGGVFLRDSKGSLYVAHSGNVGGGKQGVGKLAFLDFYPGDLEEVEWGDGVVSRVIVIGRLGSPSLMDDLGSYIHQIALFKKSVDRNEGPEPAELKFNPEFFGPRKKYMLTKAIQSVNRHGYVVNALHKYLKAKQIPAFRTKYVDLFISRKSRMTHVFEVKTDPVRDSVYKAIGQVMLHGAFEKAEPIRIMVMPKQVTRQTKDGLKRLGIRLLTYRWKGNEPVFGDIDNVIR